MYSESEYLLLSGLQHFAFCRRQWALIHLEKQWAENYHTIDGQIMHKNAHDTTFIETRGDVLIRRSVLINSSMMGISGECDVLEFHRTSEGISLNGHEGLWQPYPIEYKRGNAANTEYDSLQLCGQALCLEEMLCCSIPCGALYYGGIRRRIEVAFTYEMRVMVRTLISEMHELYSRGNTPKVKPRKECISCSLKDLCIPKILKAKAVSEYLREATDKL